MGAASIVSIVAAATYTTASAASTVAPSTTAPDAFTAAAAPVTICDNLCLVRYYYIVVVTPRQECLYYMSWLFCTHFSDFEEIEEKGANASTTRESLLRESAKISHEAVNLDGVIYALLYLF